MGPPNEQESPTQASPAESPDRTAASAAGGTAQVATSEEAGAPEVPVAHEFSLAPDGVVTPVAAVAAAALPEPPRPVPTSEATPGEPARGEPIQAAASTPAVHRGDPMLEGPLSLLQALPSRAAGWSDRSRAWLASLRAPQAEGELTPEALVAAGSRRQLVRNGALLSSGLLGLALAFGLAVGGEAETARPAKASPHVAAPAAPVPEVSPTPEGPVPAPAPARTEVATDRPTPKRKGAELARGKAAKKPAKPGRRSL